MKRIRGKRVILMKKLKLFEMPCLSLHFFYVCCKIPYKNADFKKHVWKVCIFFHVILYPFFFFLSSIPDKFWRIAENVFCNLYYSCASRVYFSLLRRFFQSTVKYWLLQNCTGIFLIGWRYKCRELTGFSLSLWTYIKLYVKHIFLPNSDSSSINTGAAVPGTCWKE